MTWLKMIYAECKTKVGDNFGENSGSEDGIDGVWKKTCGEVTEGREIGDGVIEDEDQAMNPFSFDNARHDLEFQSKPLPKIQTKYLRETESKCSRSQEISQLNCEEMSDI